MKAGLQLRLAQHLTLTPQLQQSIRLLQLSTLELQQEIETALAENPLLELADADGGEDSAHDEVVEVYVAPIDREQMLGGSDEMSAFSVPDRDDVREGPVDVADAGQLNGQTDPNDFTCGHGIAFIDGFLYATRWNDVRRFPYNVGDRQAVGSPELVATLGMENPLDYRFTHTLDRAPNGDVLVSRGRYDSNTCDVASMGERVRVENSESSCPHEHGPIQQPSNCLDTVPTRGLPECSRA